MRALLGLVALPVAASFSPPCESPFCGAFWAGVLPNCTFFKMLVNTYPEFTQPLPASACGEGMMHTAQDKGTPWFGGTGHGSYLFFASDDATVVHQIVTSKADEARFAVSVKAQLPATRQSAPGLWRFF